MNFLHLSEQIELKGEAMKIRAVIEYEFDSEEYEPSISNNEILDLERSKFLELFAHFDPSKRQITMDEVE